MSGILQFELKNWVEAVELLKKAKVIYDKLGSALSGEMAQVYLQKVQDIEPSIRYSSAHIILYSSFVFVQ